MVVIGLHNPFALKSRFKLACRRLVPWMVPVGLPRIYWPQIGLPVSVQAGVEI